MQLLGENRLQKLTLFDLVDLYFYLHIFGISCFLGLPQTRNVAKDDLELLMILPHVVSVGITSMQATPISDGAEA